MQLPNATEPEAGALEGYVHRFRMRLIRLVTLTVAIVAVIGGLSLLWRWHAGADPDRIWTDAEAALRAGRIDLAAAGLHKLEALRSPTPLDWLLRQRSRSRWS